MIKKFSYILKIYEPSVCRSFGVHYVGKSQYMDAITDEFAIDIGSPENSKQCYCREKDICPKKGVKTSRINSNAQWKHYTYWFHSFVGTFDLFRCINAPLIGSQPHFYGADPSLVANFESGINPKKEDHAIFMHFEMVYRNVTINLSFNWNFQLMLMVCQIFTYRWREHYFGVVSGCSLILKLCPSKRYHTWPICVKCIIRCFGQKKVPLWTAPT